MGGWLLSLGIIDIDLNSEEELLVLPARMLIIEEDIFGASHLALGEIVLVYGPVEELTHELLLVAKHTTIDTCSCIMRWTTALSYGGA